MSMTPRPNEYEDWLRQLKEFIAHARRRAITDVNVRLTHTYWTIGREIAARQAADGWGASVVEQIAADLRSEFPEMTGLSPRNLRYMLKLAKEWPDFAILQQAAAKLPWGSNQVLLDRVRTPELRRWYAQIALENSWSRPVLVHQIESRLHERQGRSLNNFESTMPVDEAAAAEALFKDPYLLDFVDLGVSVRERDLERALISKVQKLLLEFGKGFAFVGNQYPLNVGDQDFFVDILFYHIKLKRYVVVDLKIGDFEPEFVGKMNFYLQAVDMTVAEKDDNPSIGLILCRGRNGLVVEYALRAVGAPMAVSQYTMLPPELAELLPDPEFWEETVGIRDVGEDLDAEQDGDEPSPDAARDDIGNWSSDMKP